MGARSSSCSLVNTTGTGDTKPSTVQYISWTHFNAAAQPAGIVWSTLLDGDGTNDGGRLVEGFLVVEMKYWFVLAGSPSLSGGYVVVLSGLLEPKEVTCKFLI